MKDYIVC